VSEVVGDFPLVHPAMYGKPTRYAYIAMTDTTDPTGQIKVGSSQGGLAFLWRLPAVQETGFRIEGPAALNEHLCIMIC
jgi:hypothetical protein